MNKYIPVEKLKAEIERRKKAIHSTMFNDEYDDLLNFVHSLRQEQPMPDSTKLIELWHEDKDMLKEKDFRDDPWRLAYNAFMCGFGRGLAVNKQEQQEKTCKTCGFYENNCPFIRDKHIPYPNKVCKDYIYSVMKAQEQPSLPPNLDEAAEKATGEYVYNEGGPFSGTTGVSFINGHTPLCEDYVSFETAKLLKEKGFDVYVPSFYDDEGKFSGKEVNWNWNIGPRYSAPTLQMAMKWLREVHHCVICITPLGFYCGEIVSEWGYCIWADDNTEVNEESSPRLESYEEACEAAIKYCLENLI